MERRGWVAQLPWILVVGLLLVLLWRGSPPRAPVPAAQDTNGVYAFSGFDQRGIGGVMYVVDTNRQTICVYRALGNDIRMLSARSYTFDVQVEDSDRIRKTDNLPAGGTYDGIRAWVLQNPGKPPAAAPGAGGPP
jgi:hypothetical protein